MSDVNVGSLWESGGFVIMVVRPVGGAFLPSITGATWWQCMCVMSPRAEVRFHAPEHGIWALPTESWRLISDA